MFFLNPFLSKKKNKSVEEVLVIICSNNLESKMVYSFILSRLMGVFELSFSVIQYTSLFSTFEPLILTHLQLLCVVE